jgi:phosphoglucosamine mutase
LIAALQVLAVLVRSGKRASEACRVFSPLPQLLRNVRYSGISPLVQPGIQTAIAAASDRLRLTGRVLIRASGTEPLIRVMAEGEDYALIQQIVEDLCVTIARAA